LNFSLHLAVKCQEEDVLESVGGHRVPDRAAGVVRDRPVATTKTPAVRDATMKTKIMSEDGKGITTSTEEGIAVIPDQI
jgi:hypothetical protein